MLRTLTLLVIVALLLPAAALAATPQNFRTSITVQPPQSTGEPHTVTVAAGSGSYWVAESVLGAYFEYATWRDDVLEWQATLDPLYFIVWVRESDPIASDGWVAVAHVQSSNPLGMGQVYQIKAEKAGEYRVCGYGFYGWITDCETADIEE